MSTSQSLYLTYSVFDLLFQVDTIYFRLNKQFWCHIDYSFDDPPTEDDEETDQNGNVDTPYENQNTGLGINFPL